MGEFRQFFVVCWLSVCLFAVGLVWAQEPGEADDADVPVLDGLFLDAGRQVYWRGEVVELALRIPRHEPTTLKLVLRNRLKQELVVAEGLTVHAAEGRGWADLLLPTALLGEGEYVIRAELPDRTCTALIYLKDTLAPSPSMVLDESPEEQLAPIAEVASLGGYMQWQDFTDRRRTALPERLDQLQDVFMAGGVLSWVQPGDRAIMMVPPFSPKLRQEYQRQLMVSALRRVRYPSYAGMMFDYDPDGFVGQAGRMAERWQWGPLQDDVHAWMREQEADYRQDFTDRTGVTPLSPEERRDLAVAMAEPGLLEARSRPTRRWARDLVAFGAGPAADSDAARALWQRHEAWQYGLMSLHAERYRGFQAQLDRLEPGLQHSSCLPLANSLVRDGSYLPGAMAPLDFRYMSTWDVAGGEPTHMGQAEFNAAILNAGRSREQPLWITASLGDLNGTLFRTALRLAGSGVQGVGYSYGSSSALAYSDKSDGYLLRNSTRNQEIALTGQMMTRFGGIWSQATPVRRVGLLFSRRQSIMDGTRLGSAERHHLIYTLLAHAGVAPQIVTEEMLDRDLPRDLQVLIVVGQSERLEASRELRLRQFAMQGGSVIMDSHSTVPWDFARRDAALDLPRRLAEHPLIDGRPADRQDGEVMRLKDLIASRVPRLRTLLQGVVRQNTLDSLEPDILVAELSGGQAIFVTVTNERVVDSRQTMRPAELDTPEGMRLTDSASAGLVGSWLPVQTQLLVSRLPGQGANPTIYNLFAPGAPVVPMERGGSLWLDCDLSGAPGALYALYPTPVGPGRLLCNQRIVAGLPLNVSYQATSQNQNPLHAVVPIEVELVDVRGARLWKVYRATDASGSYSEFLPTDRFLGESKVTLRVRNLLDGGGQELDILTTPGAAVTARATDPTRVRSPASLQTFLAGKPSLVVPVFHADYRDAATQLVAQLQQRGLDAQLDSVPAVVPYPVGYRPDPATADGVARVDAGRAFGRVRMKEGVDVWHARHYAAEVPGYRYGGHVILMGTPGQNPVLDALVGYGLVWTPRVPMVPGTVIVQHLPLALSPGHDTIVIYAADHAGLLSGIQAVVNPPYQDDVTDGVRLARRNRLQQRGLPLRTATVQTITDQSSSRGVRAPTRPLESPRFVVTPVVKVQPWGDDLVVQLGRWGQSVALIDKDGKVRPFLALNGLNSVGTGPNLLITGTPTMTMAWNREGRCIWRASGQFVTLLPRSDMAVVERDQTYYVVHPSGRVTRYDTNLPGNPERELSYGTRLLLKSDGKRTRVVGAVLVDKSTNEDVTEVPLTLKRLGRNQFGVEELIRTGRGGLAAMVFRRYLGVNHVTVYNRGLKRVFPLTMSTRYLTDGDVSVDERWLAIAGMEGSVLIYDLAGVPAQSATVGAFPMITPMETGGFVVVSSDGRMVIIDKDAEKVRHIDLIATLGPMDAEATYSAIRQGPLVELEPTSIATPDPALSHFRPHVYADPFATDTAEWARPLVALNVIRERQLDFRFADRAIGYLDFAEARTYRVTIHAAAKPWGARPQTNGAWEYLVDWRQAAVADQPARTPRFQLFLDGRPVATARPEGGELRPWVARPDAPRDGRLHPTEASMTPFSVEIEIPAGRHRLGIEALDMQDVLVTLLEIR